jgi:hypothetical protein
MKKRRTQAEVPLQAGDEMALLHNRIEFVQAFLRDSGRKRRTDTNAGGLSRSCVAILCCMHD